MGWLRSIQPVAFAAIGVFLMYVGYSSLVPSEMSSGMPSRMLEKRNVHSKDCLQLLQVVRNYPDLDFRI
jgi:hypothetical protein